MLRFRSLASGSAANATLIEGRSACGQRPYRVLVDCGLSLKQLCGKLAQEGLSLQALDAVFVTHEHSDHIGPCFDIASSLHIPIWCSFGTWVGAGRPETGGMLQVARDGVAIRWGAMDAVPFTVPHDAREPLQLRVTQGAASLALLTDLGHVTPHVTEHASRCQAVLLEFNHEPELLERSRYPAFLKRRIAGRQGHLANATAAQLLAQISHADLQHVVAAHLSQQNNAVESALDWMHRATDGLTVTLAVASQADGCDWIVVAPESIAMPCATALPNHLAMVSKSTPMRESEAAIACANHQTHALSLVGL